MRSLQCELPRGTFPGVFKKHTAAERNAVMRTHWLRTKERGRARFIRREVLNSVLFWLILMPLLDLFGDHRHSTVRSIVFANLIVLPILLLGGYLEGHWRWNDLEKKYPV
jgi:hypothetical protein